MPLKIGKHHMECFQRLARDYPPANQLISCANYASRPSDHGSACTSTEGTNYQESSNVCSAKPTCVQLLLSSAIHSAVLARGGARQRQVWPYITGAVTIAGALPKARVS